MPSEYTGVKTAPPAETVVPNAGASASVTNDLEPLPTVAALGNPPTVVEPVYLQTVTDELPNVISFVAVAVEAAAVLPITVKLEPVVIPIPVEPALCSLEDEAVLDLSS